MLYDLEQPQDFVDAIAQRLDDEGIWMFEQSYLLSMLRQGAYDTICHEHLEYYAIKQIQRLLANAGLKIIDIALTGANGGSFAVYASKVKSKFPEASHLGQLIKEEAAAKLHTLSPFRAFEQRTKHHRDALPEMISKLSATGRRVLGYGASTKGNVILQYCSIDSELLPHIYEVNPDKFGCFTPGTNIPIVSESTHPMRSDDILVPLPWHFRSFFDSQLKPFIQRGGAILYPLPEIELVEARHHEAEL